MLGKYTIRPINFRTGFNYAILNVVHVVIKNWFTCNYNANLLN